MRIWYALPRPPGYKGSEVATLERLQQQKRELEDRLAEGDLSAERALDLIDQAIAARTRKIQYSRKRLAAVKSAVKTGMTREDTKPAKVAARTKKTAKSPAKKPLNRF